MVIERTLPEVWEAIARLDGVNVTAPNGSIRYLGRDVRWWMLNNTFPYVGRYGPYVPGGEPYVYQPGDQIELPWPPTAGETKVINIALLLWPDQAWTRVELRHGQPDVFVRVANARHWRRVVHDLHRILK